MFLIYLLILFFSILSIYQILAFFKNSASNTIIEGLDNPDSSEQEYKPYNLNDPNNALILAQQNAGNIEVLKGRIDKQDDVKDKVDTIQQNINSMQTQIDGLVQQQSDFAQQIAGSTPPTITGTNS